MTRVDDAKEILHALGMPRAQTNDNAAYTLLAFANVGPRTPWSKAEAVRLNPHGVIQFARARYRKDYAENTRETIRRQAIHQFVQAALLLRNPDAPELATNSPRTHYALSDEALIVIRQFRTPGFKAATEAFRVATDGGLAARRALQQHLHFVDRRRYDATATDLCSQDRFTRNRRKLGVPSRAQGCTDLLGHR